METLQSLPLMTTVTQGVTAPWRNVDYTVNGTQTINDLYLRLFTETNSRWIKTELVKAKR